MSAFPGQLAGVGAMSAGGGGAGARRPVPAPGRRGSWSGQRPGRPRRRRTVRVRGGGCGRGEPPCQQCLGHLGGRGGTVRAARRRTGMGADRLGLGPRATEPAELAQDLVQAPAPG